jgi:hypothetical protein
MFKVGDITTGGKYFSWMDVCVLNPQKLGLLWLLASAIWGNNIISVREILYISIVFPLWRH